jgi:hypothetical protein
MIVPQFEKAPLQRQSRLESEKEKHDRNISGVAFIAMSSVIRKSRPWDIQELFEKRKNRKVMFVFPLTPASRYPAVSLWAEQSAT